MLFAWLFNWLRPSSSPPLTMRTGGYTGNNTSLFSLHPNELVLSAPVVKKLRKHLGKGELPRDLERSIQQLLKRSPQPVSKAEFARVCQSVGACGRKSAATKKKKGVSKTKHVKRKTTTKSSGISKHHLVVPTQPSHQ